MNCNFLCFALLNIKSHAKKAQPGVLFICYVFTGDYKVFSGSANAGQAAYV